MPASGGPITGGPLRASQPGVGPGSPRPATLGRHRLPVKPSGYCLFETPLGTCGIAWRGGLRPVVTAVQLPEATSGATESRIARKSGANRQSVPPPEIRAVLERIRLHLGGEVQDFRSVPVDLSDAAPFFRQVYEVTREIPPGQTRTYGEIAKAAGRQNAQDTANTMAGSLAIALTADVLGLICWAWLDVAARRGHSWPRIAEIGRASCRERV